MNFFHAKNLKIFLSTGKCSFNNPAANFSQDFEKMRSITENSKQTKIFFQPILLPKMFLWQCKFDHLAEISSK